MTGLMDGGFFWFDAKAGDSDDLTIEDAAWSVPVEARRGSDGTLSIAITTFNRAPYCLNQLKAIAADANVRGRLDTIYCTDQGTDLVRDEPGFAAVAKDLGSQLTYVRQRNMGGSGGFARGMYETVKAGKSDYTLLLDDDAISEPESIMRAVQFADYCTRGSGGFARGMYETVKAGKSDYTLLLDDDAISEPESIMRAVQFADYCTRPTIVGGGMFHLDNRTMLPEGSRAACTKR